jgi:cytoskeleton protein RodZ
LPSFGEKLKLEREKRKITLEQISVSTKIGTRMLQALEEDKFNQLPGGIFNKGFVRAYSRVVGLDEDQTVAEYLQASGDAPSVSAEIVEPDDGARENAENLSRLDASAGAPTRQLPWGLFAALLLVVALALSLWSHRQRQHTKESGRPTPTASSAQVPAERSSGQIPGQVSSEVSGRASGAGSTATGSRTVGSASSAAPKSSENSAPAAAPGQFTVVIQAREDSWISITSDGRTLSSELMAAGTERAVQGRREVIVKSGNAGGTDFLFNGKKLDIGGEFGEVKLVTFGPRGIVPNAPEPPSTP